MLPSKHVLDIKHFQMWFQLRAESLARCHRCLRPQEGGCSPMWSQAWLMNPLPDNCDRTGWQLMSPLWYINHSKDFCTQDKGISLQEDTVTYCELNIGPLIWFHSLIVFSSEVPMNLIVVNAEKVWLLWLHIIKAILIKCNQESLWLRYKLSKFQKELV